MRVACSREQCGDNTDVDADDGSDDEGDSCDDDSENDDDDIFLMMVTYLLWFDS